MCLWCYWRYRSPWWWGDSINPEITLFISFKHFINAVPIVSSHLVIRLVEERPHNTWNLHSMYALLIGILCLLPAEAEDLLEVKRSITILLATYVRHRKKTWLVMDLVSKGSCQTQRIWLRNKKEWNYSRVCIKLSVYASYDTGPLILSDKRFTSYFGPLHGFSCRPKRVLPPIVCHQCPRNASVRCQYTRQDLSTQCWKETF